LLNDDGNVATAALSDCCCAFGMRFVVVNDSLDNDIYYEL
jgi:hypothetical protein